MHVYILPVRIYLSYTGAGNVATRSTKNPFAYIVIIAVKQETKIVVIHPVIGQVRSKQKCFEKPGTVCQVPFGRAHKVYWLGYIILCMQVAANGFGFFSYGMVMFRETHKAVKCVSIQVTNYVNAKITLT